MDELVVPPETRSVAGGSSSGSPSSASGPRTPPTPQPHPASPTTRLKRKAEDVVPLVDSDEHETASPAQEATVVPPPKPRYLQPAEFYPLNNGSTITSRAAGPWARPAEEELSPEDDPDAHRGIPIFRPSMEEFKDFEGYVERTTPWGARSGIIKIIPPPEWTASLPRIPNQALNNISISSPIQQTIQGSGGLFRVVNVERNKNRPLTVKEWYEKCQSEKFAGPGPKDTDRSRDRDLEASKKARAAQLEERRRKREERRNEAARRRAKKEAKDVKIEEEGTFPEAGPSSFRTSPEPQGVADEHFADGEDDLQVLKEENILPASQQTEGESGPSHSRRPPTAAMMEQRRQTEAPWYETFDPWSGWLPRDTSPSDYTPEACHEMDKKFWRKIASEGESSWYGADLQGSLFQNQDTPWNVSNLPNLLNRCRLTKKLPGVNTPYLYFGMWGATFAYHVEDMDLFSINYIHFGAPKFWYAIPQAQAEKFERTIAQYFPLEAKSCDQFLRHKAFTISPTRLAEHQIRVNMLVQHQNEFVITFPRGYHAGFNMGFNCAESINFALDSWIELGRRAKVCDCVSHSVRINVDEMLAAEDELVEAITEERRTKKRKSRAGEGRSMAAKREPRDISADGDVAMANALENGGTPERPKFPINGMDKPKKVTPISKTTRKLTIKVEPVSYPCLFCPSVEAEGLTVVDGASEAVQARSKSRQPGLFAHHSCAVAIPEVGLDDKEINGVKVPVVVNVDAIPSDRWNLKCVICKDKKLAATGAKIQCTKGKCPRAFHVSCARNSDEVKLEVFQVQDWQPLAIPEDAPEGTQPEVIQVESIRVNCLCPTHNPDIISIKRRKAEEALKANVLALLPGSRIKLKAFGSWYEATLLGIDEGNKSVEVVGVSGLKTIEPWSRIEFRDREPVKLLENEYARVHTHTRRPTGPTPENTMPGRAPLQTSVEHPSAVQQAAPAHRTHPPPFDTNGHRPTPPYPRYQPQHMIAPPAWAPASSGSHPNYVYPSYPPPPPEWQHRGNVQYILNHQSQPPIDTRVLICDAPPQLQPHRSMPGPSRYANQYPSPSIMHPMPAGVARHNLVAQGQVTASPGHPAAYTSYVPSGAQGDHRQTIMSAGPGPLPPPPAPPAAAGKGQISLGLQRMQAIMRFLPDLAVPVIHLAGTNGKGSVSAMLESALLRSGLRVGRYNSPHLITPRDAIRVNGRPPAEEHYAMALRYVSGQCRLILAEPTPFELATATALHLLNMVSPSLQVLIVECGMGGAQDATNIIPSHLKIACGLTSVGMDHMSFLGSTIEAIATEKSQISVEGCLFFIAPQSHENAATTAQRVALSRKARVLRTNPAIVTAFTANGNRLALTKCPGLPSSSSKSDVLAHEITTELPLPGDHQLGNLALAVSILHAIRSDVRATFIQPDLANITTNSICAGVASTVWEGRCSWLRIPTASAGGQGMSILVDGAHNADSAKALRQYIDSLPARQQGDVSPVTFILGLSASKDKTPESVLQPLLRAGDHVIATTFSPVEGMLWVSPIDPDTVVQSAQAIVGVKGNVLAATDVADALRRANAGSRLTVVCGSLYLVADLYRLFPPDSLRPNEFIPRRDATAQLCPR